MAARLVIEGGVPLRGDVQVSAAKNAALPLLAASLLSAEPVVLDNVPRLADVATIKALLQGLGTEIEEREGSTVARTAVLRSVEAPYELVSTMRASVLVLGPLLARAGRARVSMPGGCAIGVRPIDLHLKGLERLGAEVTLAQGYVEARAARLKGARIVFDLVTVTGTENLMMAAALAEGTTILENAAREPEVPDLARLLTAMGARIHGAGTERIEIEGVPELGGARHRIIPDRVEAGTFLVAGAITGGDVTVRDVVPAHLSAVLDKLEATGARLEIGADRVRISAEGRPRATDLVTNPFPGFATDMQAQMMALLGLAEGSSVITETIFENRFQHAAELRRLGAGIEIEGNRAVIRGVPAYQGARVMATDLRASASLVLGGLAAWGTTEVSRVYHLDRGYERMEQKLAALGARIRRER
ncbi:MAG TPA: UDP-N-acetylglucosamine 1-carboxyvinyltransferase [Methylomirabilota bacterium]|jgi:UDP-N-acetylglucosamine 1-carboxyvinyltransferase|nr:UDP-N-acetylglucosamine 1-carboxyvinyltransferase [Methylomirabilota bacterium]